eukprot:gb/GECH01002594.1/.p1 GENE.gb/GECH01002594.1/~~gb/GECH01002594.1/.p1  ORF type:complete len:999 (+),score=228.83 gb/GECH01002594.1/:1-2997(+)
MPRNHRYIPKDTKHIDKKHKKQHKKQVSPDHRSIISDLKTGEDAVAFFSRSQQSPVKFVYLNRADTGLKFRPYDLVVVSREETNSEYFTMSASGVVHVCPGLPTEFISLSDWMRESTLFNVLTRIGFFKNYIIGKTFKLWRKNVRFSLFCKTRNNLFSNLFLVKDTFLPTLFDVMDSCETIRNTSVFNFPQSKTYYLLESFRNEQDEILNEAKNQLDSNADSLESLLVNLCENVASRARVPDMNSSENIEAYLMGTMQGNISGNSGESKTKSMAAKRKEHADKVKALRKAMAEAEMLGNFIRLIDYLASEALVSLVVNTLSRYFQVLSDSQKTIMFQITLGLDSDGMNFTPDGKELLKQFNYSVENITNSASEVRRVLYMKPFRVYVENDDENSYPTWHVGTVIRRNESFMYSKEGISNLFKEDFDAVKSYGKMFEFLQNWYDMAQSWNTEEYSSREHSISNFREDLNQLKQALKEIKEMQVSKELGVLYVESKNLRNSLIPQIEGILDDVKSTIISTAAQKCKTMLSEFQHRIKLLQESPDRLNTFADFVSNLSDIKDNHEWLVDQSEEVDSMYYLLEQNKFSIPTDDLVQADMLRETREKFNNQLSSAESLKEEKLPGMSKSLEQKISSTNKEILDITANLRSEQFTSASADPKIILEELDEIQQSVNTIQNKTEMYRKFQELFGIKPTEWTNLTDMLDQFQSIRNVWQSIDTWLISTQEWKNIEIPDLNIEKLEQEVKEYSEKAKNLQEKLRDDASDYLRKEIKRWEDDLNSIIHLCNSDMENHHWKEIFDNVNTPVFAVEGPYTLEQLESYSVFDYPEQIAHVSKKASAEKKIQVTLERVNETWSNKKVELESYPPVKDGLLLPSQDENLKSISEDLNELEECISSQFIGELKSQAQEWSQTLDSIKILIKNWLQVQSQWQHCEFFMSSDEIKQELHDQAVEFKQIDREYKDFLNQFKSEPKVISHCNDQNRELLENISKTLEEIQVSLAGFLV